MKTLEQSLIDYEMALLEAIAACRGIPLATPNRREAIAILGEAMLSPAAMAITLDHLSTEEAEAFQFVLDHGGQIEGPRFTRHFGVIRQMGSARLAREQPWNNPVNPAEGLWYKGLIFKAFQLMLHGNTEIIYIATDLLSVLEWTYATATPSDADDPAEVDSDGASEETSTLEPPPGQAKIFHFPSKANEAGQLPDEKSESPKSMGPPPFLTLTKPPSIVVSGEGRLREGMFSLLVYLQTHALRVDKEGQLDPLERQALLACLPPPPHPTVPLPLELEFLLHLGQRAGLLNLKHGRIKPDRDATRTWLQTPAAEQDFFLQNTWRADPTWNDLKRTPTLDPQATGWENSPLLARSKILGYLTQEKISPDAWLSLDSFITAIKRLDPDFQRPNGDYESWYIYDRQGHPLMGFNYWDQVEGALIRFILTEILLTLGIVELGMADTRNTPVSFRLSSAGEAFLSSQLEVVSPPKTPVYLRVGANFQVHVPSQVSLYDRFQLARFAELERREDKRVVYLISQASIGQALRNGVTADQVVAFLARATNNQTPLKVVETLRVWGTRQGTAYLERATVLRLKDEKQVQELLQNPALRPLLGEVIGPTAIIVPSENTLEARRILIELGYLDQL